LYPISLRPRAFVAAGCAAAAALAAVAAVALAAASVSMNRSCYVVGQSGRLSGSGFAPSSQFTVTVDGVLYGTKSTDSNGTFSIKLLTGRLPAGAGQHTGKVTVDDGSGDIASTSFTLTRRALALLSGVQRSSHGETGRFKIWGFSLDGSTRRVYLHYVGPSGKVNRTVALGSTSGACGSLVSKRELFVPFSLSRGTWTLQVDTSRSYARHPDGPSSRIRVQIG
jgi:uncharacterized membrane protein